MSLTNLITSISEARHNILKLLSPIKITVLCISLGIKLTPKEENYIYVGIDFYSTLHHMYYQ